MQRRTFFVSSSVLAGTALAEYSCGQSIDSRRRVAVIGHTGRGNYGHGLDTVWMRVPAVEIVAVADPDKAGLAKELAKLKIEKGYADYRKMLEETKPEFVSICPRHPDQHHDMALAAIESGVKGLYLEKPFCRTPAEADSLIAACVRHGAKIAVAHRNRYHPAIPHIDRLLAEGRLGKLLEIRGRGKGDRRGGDEDLWVLGSHVLDLIHHFAGDPTSCSALMLKNGRPVTPEDVKPGAEGLGPLAADEVHVRYETTSGTVAYFDSIANDGTNNNAYCLQLIGSQGIVTMHVDREPVAHFAEGTPFHPSSSRQPWIPITSAGLGKAENDPELIQQVHNHVLAVRDLIDACDNDRDPLCDVRAGATTVEMICAAFASHRQGGKTLPLPLEQREHALSDW